MAKKTVLFAGHSMSPYALSIIKNLEALDFKVVYFDHYSPNFMSKIFGLIRNTLLPKSWPIEQRLNDYINEIFINLAIRLQPDLILIYKGRNIYSQTINRLRSNGFVVVNWYPDYFDDWWWISTNAASYNYFFTPCLYVQRKLKEIGIKSYYLPFAADKDKSFITRIYNYQATFVGRWTKRRDKLFKKVFQAGLLDVWGYRHWQDSSYKSVFHGQVTPNQTKAIIRQSKITLNTLTGTDNTPIISVNYRVFEATGVGGFVLTWYHEPLEEFFKIGEEIEIFRTAEEALEKAKYYLKHDTTREKIARAGWRRTLQDHTYKTRLKQLLKIIH